MALESKLYFDKRETLEREERENILFENFSKKLKTIASLSVGWKNILSSCNLDNIKSRNDLCSIPITRKSSLTNMQKDVFPYGGLTTKSYNQFPYIFASPGPIYEPGDHNDFWNMSRGLYAAGLRKEILAYNTFSYHLGPAGLMMQNAANNIGSTVIPGGTGNTELQIETICNLKPSFYIGTPSFLKILHEIAKKNNNDISCFRNGLVGAEPLTTALRNELSNNGTDVLQMYGIAEAGCIAYETKDLEKNLNHGMIIEEDIILEIVRPGTLHAVPHGDVGEIVITKISSEYPVIRLGTGDLSKIISDPSPCGRTNLRIQGWMGRAEQSTKFKGIFVTIDQLNKVVNTFKEISKVRFIITTKDFIDNGELLCETKDRSDQFNSKVKEFFKNNFKLNINVSFVNEGSIPNDGLVIEDKRILD